MRAYRVTTSAVKTSAVSGTAVNALSINTGAARTCFIYRIEVGLWDAINSTDGQLQAQLFGVSALTAGTALTPVPLDAGTPAAATVATYAPTVVTTSGEPLVSFVFNQRANGLWIAERPGAEIVLPAGGTAVGTLVLQITENTIAAQQTLNITVCFYE